MQIARNFKLLVLTGMLAIGTPCASAAEPDATPAAIPAGTYTLDKSHASLLFKVNHLGFSNYTARFKRFDATLQFDPANLAASSVVATIDVRSLETDYPEPKKHDFNTQLQNAEWLDAAKFPQMMYRSKKVEAIGANNLRIEGELTLHGITQPVILEATYNGGYVGHPMDPHARIGFSAHGTLKRSQFGVAYGIPQPGSTMGVGDDVQIIIEAEFSGPAWAGAKAIEAH
jgi:polyisoprenoid-binding protein YceI